MHVWAEAGAHLQLAGLLRDLEESLERQCFDGLGQDQKGPVEARKRFFALLKEPFEPIEPSCLSERLAALGTVVVGDYHPLPESKYALLQVVERLTARGRPLLLVLGCLQAGHKAVVPQPDPEKFLRDRGRGWPFPLEPWLPLIWFAANRKLPVAGLRGRGEGGLEEAERYRLWGKRLERFSRDEDRLVLAVVGEVHSAPHNLPTYLCSSSVVPNPVGSLLLAPPSLYWRLLSAVPDPCSVGVSLGGDEVLALVPVHPLRRANSYLAWLEKEPELIQPPATAWHPESWTACTSAFREALERVAAFFRVSATILGVPDIVLPRHMDKLQALLKRLTEDEAHVLTYHMAHNQSYFHAGRCFIYLARLTLSHVGEELSHAVHVQVSPVPRQVQSPEDSFYHHVVREAVAFLGSKSLNSFRYSPSRRELSSLGRNEEDPLGAHVASAIVEQLDADKRRLPKGKPTLILPEVLFDPEFANAVAHGLGYLIGESLWQGLQRGAVEHEAIAALVRRRLDAVGQPGHVYAQLLSMADSDHEG